MKPKLQLLVLLVLALSLAPLLSRAQETSRVIPFNNVATTLAPCAAPPCPQAVSIQLWDVAAGETTPVFSENQPVNVDEVGNISFIFGSATTAGLNPANFPSGSSRSLDVVDRATGLSVLAARLPLN